MRYGLPPPGMIPADPEKTPSASHHLLGSRALGSHFHLIMDAGQGIIRSNEVRWQLKVKEGDKLIQNQKKGNTIMYVGFLKSTI